MKTTSRFLALTIMVLLAPASSADEAATRSAFGLPEAQALDALVATIHPGGRLQWSPSLAVVLADGSRKELRVRGLIHRADAAGHTFVMSLEYPANEAKIGAALDAMLTPAETARAELFAFKTNAQFVISGLRRAPLQDSGWITRVGSIARGSDFRSATWPTVVLSYTGYYGTSEWVGQVEWQAAYSTESMNITNRLPGFVARMAKDGATLVDMEAFVVPTGTDTYDIYSPDQKRFILSCAIPCLPDGKVMLGLWGPTSGAVAVKP